MDEVSSMKDIKTQILILLKIAAGCLLVSIAIHTLYLPSKLLAGGVSGVVMLFNLLFGANTGFLYFLINIPLFIIGIIFLPRKFMFFTLYGISVFAGALSLTQGLHLNTQSPLTAILLGGAIYGMGNGLVYAAGGSMGGTDIIAKIIQRKYAISMATVGFGMNLIIIGISMYFFGIDISVYTLAAMFVASQVSNFVIDGINHKRMVFIISEDKPEELASGILEELGRGVTILSGEGAYTGKQKKVMYCVIGITQVAQLRSVVKRIDEKAFVTITDTAQVYGQGRGFYSVRDEI